MNYHTHTTMIMEMHDAIDIYDYSNPTVYFSN